MAQADDYQVRMAAYDALGHDQVRAAPPNGVYDNDKFLYGNGDVSPISFIWDAASKSYVSNPNVAAYKAAKEARISASAAQPKPVAAVQAPVNSTPPAAQKPYSLPPIPKKSAPLLTPSSPAAPIQAPIAAPVNTSMTPAPSPITAPVAPRQGLLTPIQNIAPTTRQVTPDELASYQLEKLTAGDSVMRQRAETAGIQMANRRGLLNSREAGNAAFGEFVDRATPLATADANRYGSVADRNMDAQNAFGLADKQFGFDSALQGNEFGFKSGENALDRSLTQSESAADRANRLDLQGMGDAAAMARQTNSQGWQSGENALTRDFSSGQNALDRTLTQSENRADRASSESLQGMSDAAALSRLNMSNQFEGGERALDRTANIEEAQAGRDFTAGENQLNRDANTAATMQAAEIAADAALTQHLYGLEELGYRFNLDGYNVSKTYAAGLMGTLQEKIGALLADPNLDQASKDNAINNMITQTNDMLKFGSDLYSSTIPTYGVAGSGGQQTPTPQAPSTVVASLYQKLLGRAPDPEGAQFWTQVMQQNNLTPAQLESEMMKSAGYAQYVASNMATV